MQPIPVPFRRYLRGLKPMVAALGVMGTTCVMAQGASIGMELNKLEDQEGACRAYLVFRNNTAQQFAEFRLDLVIFNIEGLISRRLALDVAPLRADKTSVKLFDINGLGCADIDQILVNDVIACQGEGGSDVDCVGLLDPTSRGETELIK